MGVSRLQVTKDIKYGPHGINPEKGRESGLEALGRFEVVIDMTRHRSVDKSKITSFACDVDKSKITSFACDVDKSEIMD